MHPDDDPTPWEVGYRVECEEHTGGYKITITVSDGDMLEGWATRKHQIPKRISDMLRPLFPKPEPKKRGTDV